MKTNSNKEKNFRIALSMIQFSNNFKADNHLDIESHITESIEWDKILSGMIKTTKKTEGV
ncbi:MAG: hypothetical protein JW774_07025 [Candidatus Aureabacteria bacterium]|nr:hypothetical protein [Candidatus Auribacterota bacterium]